MSDEKTAPVGDNSEQDDSCAASSESGVRIKVDSHMLMLADEKDLLNNETLNDHHINFAQTLLKKQFPDIDGLGHTLLQTRPPIKSISNGLQIVFDQGDHWIVASSIACDSCTIQVYDSLHSVVDKTSEKVIFNLFEKSRRKVVQVNVQKQLGGQACRLLQLQYQLPCFLTLT